MEFDEEIGQRIRSLRETAKSTQEYVASEIGINRTALGLIEAGERKIYVHELVKLAKVFCLTVDEIVSPPAKSDMDVFDFILWRLDYNATDMGEIGKYVRWEYIVNFVNEAREKYG